MEWIKEHKLKYREQGLREDTKNEIVEKVCGGSQHIITHGMVSTGQSNGCRHRRWKVQLPAILPENDASAGI